MRWSAGLWLVASSSLICLLNELMVDDWGLLSGRNQLRPQLMERFAKAKLISLSSSLFACQSHLEDRCITQTEVLKSGNKILDIMLLSRARKVL